MEDEYELTIGRMKMTRESDAATQSGGVDQRWRRNRGRDIRWLISNSKKIKFFEFIYIIKREKKWNTKLQI